MVEVHLYGKLRRHAPGPQPDGSYVVRLDATPGETVGSLLARLGVTMEEVSHIFLNGLLLFTCNTMAPWLGYRQVAEDVWGQKLHTGIAAQDRIGLFGQDMAALVV